MYTPSLWYDVFWPIELLLGCLHKLSYSCYIGQCLHFWLKSTCELLVILSLVTVDFAVLKWNFKMLLNFKFFKMCKIYPSFNTVETPKIFQVSQFSLQFGHRLEMDSVATVGLCSCCILKYYMYGAVCITSWIVFSLCGHDVDYGWFSSYFHCIILYVVGLQSHYVFIVLILCSIYIIIVNLKNLLLWLISDYLVI